MKLEYLFSCSLTFSTHSASNTGGKTDKDKVDHDIGISVLLFFNFQSLLASNMGKTYKDKGDHDTGIPFLMFFNF
jgi:hypothetical protein